MIKVVGYELRRKIRTQIRLVKKLISEGTLQAYIKQRKTIPREKQPKTSESETKYNKKAESYTQSTRKVSPARISPDRRSYERTDRSDTRESRQSAEGTTEYSSSYMYNERRTSSDYITSKTKRERSPELKPSRDSSTGKDKSKKLSPEKEIPLRSSPDRKITSKTETGERFTKLKKTVSTSKSFEDDKPEWAKQRNLRKTTETSTPSSRKTTTTKTTTITRNNQTRSSPSKEIKTTDLITSSYGVGPTDENGAPLFGLKALRAQNKSTTKGKIFMQNRQICQKINEVTWKGTKNSHNK